VLAPSWYRCLHPFACLLCMHSCIGSACFADTGLMVRSPCCRVPEYAWGETMHIAQCCCYSFSMQGRCAALVVEHGWSVDMPSMGVHVGKCLQLLWTRIEDDTVFGAL
jgi:hypothetical protein